MSKESNLSDLEVFQVPAFTGSIIYVDASTGTDTRTGLSKYATGRPFLTISSALTAAVSGDRLVCNGTFNEQVAFKNLVQIHFTDGSGITRTQSSNGEILFSDNGAVVACSITGKGVFAISGGADGTILKLSASGSAVLFQGKSTSNTTSGFNFTTLQNTAASTLYVDFETISTGTGIYGIFSNFSGSVTHVRADKITGVLPIQTSGAGARMWIEADEIISTSSTLQAAVFANNGEIYVTANSIKTSSQECIGAYASNDGKIYLQVAYMESTGTGAECISIEDGEIYGHVGYMKCTGGSTGGGVPAAAVYVGLYTHNGPWYGSLTIDKIDATSGYGFWCEQGTSFQCSVGSCEASIPIFCRGGTHTFSGYFKATGTNNPVVRFDKAGTTAVTIFRGSVLEAHSGATYVADMTGAGSLAATISTYGSKINKPVDTSVITHSPRFTLDENNNLSLSGGIVGSRTVNSVPSAKTIQTVAASANGFQLSATRDAQVSYSATITTTASIGTSSSGYVVLEVAPTNSTTAADWKEVARLTSSQTLSIAAALTSVLVEGASLTAVIPVGYYCRLRSVDVSGTPAYAYVSGQETLL